MPGSDAIDELVRAIPALELERELSFRPWLQDVRRALDVRNVAIYSPVPRAAHWDFSLCEWVGHAWEEREDAYMRFVKGFDTESTGFAAYDPFAVEREQRNRVLSQNELATLDPNHRRVHARVHAAVGVTGDHQLRVLVCDGPRLLAWFGLLQGEPFRERHYHALRSLIAPLGQRLTALHRLRIEGLRGAILDALLAQMSEPVFVMELNGKVALANDAAEVLLGSADGRAELATLRRAMRGQGACPRYHLSTLQSPGLPEYRLAIREPRALPRSVLVARAVRAWQLAPKLAFVLDGVCAGASNKEIAVSLGCAEVTVERHLTRLFRVSHARSRTELATKVHLL